MYRCTDTWGALCKISGKVENILECSRSVIFLAPICANVNALHIAQVLPAIVLYNQNLRQESKIVNLFRTILINLNQCLAEILYIPITLYCWEVLNRTITLSETSKPFLQIRIWPR